MNLIFNHKKTFSLFTGKFSVESKISARPTSPKVRESKNFVFLLLLIIVCCFFFYNFQ